MGLHISHYRTLSGPPDRGSSRFSLSSDTLERPHFLLRDSRIFCGSSIIRLLTTSPTPPPPSRPRAQAGDARTVPARPQDATRASPPAATTARSKQMPKRVRRDEPTHFEGVEVVSEIRSLREGLLLTVAILNKLHERIDSVMVNLDPSPGIQLATGAFRMKRVGTIMPRETAKVSFVLKVLSGGDPSKIGGYVEFLGQTFGRVPIPPPTIIQQ
jgi:hypothetical protein